MTKDESTVSARAHATSAQESDDSAFGGGDERLVVLLDAHVFAQQLELVLQSRAYYEAHQHRGEGDDVASCPFVSAHVVVFPRHVVWLGRRLAPQRAPAEPGAKPKRPGNRYVASFVSRVAPARSWS